MNTLRVELGERSYAIHIGGALLGRGDVVFPELAGRDLMIVSSETVAPLYLQELLTGLAEFRVHQVVLPDGEQCKTLEVLNRVFDALLEARLGRDCVLVALGGGVIGDIVGFAAASYQRGVDFVQIPTTLLAQVDSSVGGKTGVNHALGKNMIGAFHQPVGVLADTDTLITLPERELRAGLAEVIKYGLICDEDFFVWLEGSLDALLAREPDALKTAIGRSCEIKAEVVSEDEREAGRRALLNLGHTFGHGIETGLGYGTWLHGEAVAAGICLAADLSARLDWIERSQVERVRALLQRAGLPTAAPPQIEPERLLDLMALDKKVSGGNLRLVLLESIGNAVLSANFDRQALRETLSACRSAA